MSVGSLSPIRPPLPRRPKFEEDGGADKFEYWESLPLEIRCMIAKKTDILTRFSLMFSSKSNYDVARSVPIKIETIKIDSFIFKEHSEVRELASGRNVETISIQLMKNNSSEEITIVYFAENENGTMVHRFWKENKKVFAAEKMLLEETNYREASMSFMDKLMALAGYQLDVLEIEAYHWERDLVCLDKLRIQKKLDIVFSTNGINFNRWLNTAKSPLEELGIHIRDYDEWPITSSQFDFNHDTIKNAKDLFIWSEVDSLKSFDISGLKCDKFDISDFEVSPEVMNQFIKEWVNGNIRKNFFHGVFNNVGIADDDFDVDWGARALLVGVNYSPWLDEYRVKGKRLSEVLKHENFVYSTYYYIESKKGDNGAVLGYGHRDGRALFHVTGKQNRTG